MSIKTTVFGLALSGGGHKGIAHAGVLQFLNEQGIFPEIISGTSAGSIVGGLYANGKKPKEILAFFKSVNLFSWSHLSFRKAGFLDADQFARYLEKEFGKKTIRELDIELYISATEIERGKLKIFHKNTQIVPAILASSAFPGVFSPVVINNKIYSDGGILNNYPVNTIQGRCDFLIGSNVNPVLMYNQTRFTSIKSIALRAFEIMMMQNTFPQNELCDWHIQPEALAEYSTFETSKKRMDEIFDIGYREAKASFEKIKDKIQ
ncbi:patatin-like phospholipase family protein [Flavobacterium sp. xlx-214]|uniref:patatin-like phospholipase family protein n=1 Tax=unclassified Flavobacterium TaxID=196869 RepID=UPI0013D09571|nr:MULTISPECIES: patatin-like phospholipase family protein [unclassified Flavobacterium]MBA5793865.1 patatin-like phospholipase family protein [Flavobacterium sp. xlx-221]QMI84834.1 patatin-like phospholipase family protein [Flavobacterium sp. xlx-214]